VTAPPTALSVLELARLFLDGVEQHFAGQEAELPDRRFIAPGNPQLIAWDCEQLFVALTGIGIGPAPDSPVQSPRQGGPVSAFNVRHAIFSIQLVRCTPTVPENGNAAYPPADQIDAAGAQSMRDAGLLSDAVVLMCSQLSKVLPPGTHVQAGLTSSLGPEGGYHANEATVAVTAMRLV
jgi:hypothetical protein